MNLTPRPNILWIIAEDFGPALSCYGRRDVSTPHIDALARSGIQFTRCFTTAPVCSPSRSAFMTGMYQTTIGAHDHRSHRDDFHPLPSGVRSAPACFREAGFTTANLRTLPLDFRGTAKIDWNFASPDRLFDTDDWDAMLRMDRPFFGILNLWETHRVFDASRKVDPRAVDLPPYYPEHPVIREDYARYLDTVLELDRKVGSLLSLLDRQGIGDNTIVLFVGDNGEAHIRAKQFCFEEGLHVPMILHLPARHRDRFAVSPGVHRGLVESIDWLPTLLRLAGINTPASMQGRAVVEQGRLRSRQYAFGARDRCDETVIRLRTVRDSRYRWIRNLTPDKGFFEPNAYKAAQYPAWNLIQRLSREGKLTGPARTLTEPTLPRTALYDLESDPHQLANLAEDPKFQSVRDRMDKALRAWMQATGDPHRGLVPS